VQNISEMKLKTYLKESYTELVEKVSWPTWSELQSSAIIVMVTSFIIALVVYVMDTFFSFTMTKIYELFA
jgi:preprotein translocase subunit SecE